MICLDGTTTWLIYIGGKMNFAGKTDSADHAAALAAAKAYTDQHYRDVVFGHRPTKQLA
jgi:hypothetical protein